MWCLWNVCIISKWIDSLRKTKGRNKLQSWYSVAWNHLTHLDGDRTESALSPSFCIFQYLTENCMNHHILCLSKIAYLHRKASSYIFSLRKKIISSAKHHMEIAEGCASHMITKLDLRHGSLLLLFVRHSCGWYSWPIQCCVFSSYSWFWDINVNLLYEFNKLFNQNV
jgi:hypothetical protein